MNIPPGSTEPGAVDLAMFYLPWVGEHARGDRLDPASGCRWHVMGESHYVGGGEDGYADAPELTRTVVADWALQPKGSAFFTRVAAVIANMPPDVVDRPAAWQKIAYSNFVQSALPGPRQPPSAVQLDHARRCFVAQLVHTLPDILLVLGQRAWQQLPDDFGWKAPPFQSAVHPEWPGVEDGWVYPYWSDGVLRHTLALPIVHPSAGYGRWNWQVAAIRAQTALTCHRDILDRLRAEGTEPRPLTLPA